MWVELQLTTNLLLTAGALRPVTLFSLAIYMKTGKTSEAGIILSTKMAAVAMAKTKHLLTTI